MSTMNMSVVKIGNYTEGHLLKQAEKIVKAKSTETPVFDQAAEDRLPKFDTDELTIGKVLGHGGFCTVREVVKVSLKDGIAASKSLGNAEPSHWAENQKRDLSQVLQDRNFMESFYLRNDKEYRYAIKRLKDDAHKDVQTFINGIVDLALEARFLAVVRHPKCVWYKSTLVYVLLALDCRKLTRFLLRNKIITLFSVQKYYQNESALLWIALFS